MTEIAKMTLEEVADIIRSEIRKATSEDDVEHLKHMEDGSIDGRDWGDGKSDRVESGNPRRGKPLKPAYNKKQSSYYTKEQRAAKKEVSGGDDPKADEAGRAAEEKRKKDAQEKLKQGIKNQETATGKRWTGPRGRGRPANLKPPEGTPVGHKGKGNPSRINSKGEIVKAQIINDVLDGLVKAYITKCVRQQESEDDQ